MPGLNVSTKKDLQKSSLLDSMDHLKYSEIDSADSFHLSKVYYEDYPIREWFEGNFEYILEGVIYNKSSEVIEKELQNAFSDEVNEKRLGEFVESCDGEFLILAHNRETGKIYLVNDMLGNLPTYYFSDQENLILSRSFDTVIKNIDEKKINKKSLIESLTLDYTLGEKTIYENVNKLPPGTLAILDVNTGEFGIESIHKWDFDSFEKNESDFKELQRNFHNSLENRSQVFKDQENCLFLSGGMDSRTVLSGLINTVSEENIVTASKTWEGSKEDKFAKDIADTVGVENILIQGDDDFATEEIIENYVKMTGGSRRITEAYCLKSQIELRTKIESPVVLFTGDFGDSPSGLMDPLEWTKDIDSTEKIAEELLKGRYRKNTSSEIYGAPSQPISCGISLEKTEKFVNKKESELLEMLKSHLDDYPEETIKGKLRRFMIVEFAKNRGNIGTEIKRNIFWTTTPFNSPKLLKGLLSMGESKKRGKKLHTKLIDKLAPELSDKPYYDYSIPILYPKLVPSISPNSKIPKSLKKIFFRAHKNYFENFIYNKRYQLYSLIPFKSQSNPFDSQKFRSTCFSFLRSYMENTDNTEFDEKSLKSLIRRNAARDRQTLCSVTPLTVLKDRY